jgi:hypothetical protein
VIVVDTKKLIEEGLHTFLDPYIAGRYRFQILRMLYFPDKRGGSKYYEHWLTFKDVNGGGIGSWSLPVVHMQRRRSSARPTISSRWYLTNSRRKRPLICRSSDGRRGWKETLKLQKQSRERSAWQLGIMPMEWQREHL